MPATTISWKANPITTLLSTELNSLGAAAGSNLGTEFDNSTGLWFFGLFQLDVTFAVAPALDSTIDLYLVPCPDGTNYNNGGSASQPTCFLEGSWPMRAITTQQLLTIRDIVLPPTKFKLMAFNNTAQAFPASGSTVKMIAYDKQAQ